ncbi:glycosyl hydrolase family 18 protein [Mucilaginibacter sp.]|uniref:glycosyl hydrolase family 18 protein n=1 Tax=Mucilaginibacter sp. TaxID=1882438 RepID=UPI0035624A68
MIKLRCLLIAILLLPIVQHVVAQSAGDKFRVIGYMRNQRGLANSIKNVDLDKITHLNIAFINPDSSGNLIVASGLKDVATLAHKNGVKVFLSIGGGTPPKYLPDFIYGGKQDLLISALTKITVDYNLDGIDVDLEGRLIDKNYEGFVLKLASALKEKSKLITAAIATVYADRYTDKALAQFNFINVMCYDKTGPWNPNKPGQHAPFDMAADDMDYWSNKRGIAKQKLSLGVPFYGYGFGTNAPESLPYKDIIAQYPGAENTDQVTVPGGGIVYYNGAPTIKAKTLLALEKAGGVMIWQLLQDTGGEKSLLRVIDDTITSQKK